MDIICKHLLNQIWVRKSTSGNIVRVGLGLYLTGSGHALGGAVDYKRRENPLHD